MSSSNLVRWGGGLACVVGGFLLAIGQIVNLLIGGRQFGAVLGGNFLLIAHVLLIFALMALYSAQAGRSGVLGLLGMAMAIVGTTLVFTIVFVTTAGAYSVQAPPTDDVSPVRSTIPAAVGWILDSAYSVLGPPFFAIGLILFGIAIMRTGRFSAWAGGLLVLGGALALLGCPVSYVYACSITFGRGAYIVFVLGTVLIGAIFVRLGWEILSRRGGEGQLHTTRTR
jgi:hypothetical protein